MSENRPVSSMSQDPFNLTGECRSDEISKLVKIPEWKPWSGSSFVRVLSGIKQGWYQNREQNIAVYMLTEVLLGLVVVFAQVPETISFALMANMDPSFGLHGAWIIGLFSTIFGGRGALVCGVTGSVSSVTAAMIVATERKDYLFPIVICAGIMLLLFSLLNLSWVLRFISKNVMIGFCNGLAIIIGMAQLHMFQDENHEYVTGEIAVHMVVMCVSSMFIFNFWGKVPYAGKYVPAAFTALVFAALYEVLIVWLWRDTRTVSIGDIGNLSPDYRYPQFFWKLPGVGPYNWTDIGIILNKSFSFFLVMCLESLMTVNVLDVLYGNKSDGNQSMFAIGISNIVSGLCGGLGGNTMIGLSGLLYRSGGCGKEGPLVCAILMFIVVTCLSPYLNYFPTAGLAGIMFIVVIHTFSIDSIAMIFCSLVPSKYVLKKPWLQRRIPRFDALILLLVTIAVPLYGLDVGILTGMIMSAFAFADASLRQVQIYKHYANRENIGTVAVYDIVGPLFFSSADIVNDAFDPIDDPSYVIIRMNNSSIMDYSALETLSEVKLAYEKLGKTLHIKHLTKKCEDKIHLSQARLDWDKAHFDHYEVDVPRLVEFADELPTYMPGTLMNSWTQDHKSRSIAHDETSAVSDCARIVPERQAAREASTTPSEMENGTTVLSETSTF